MRPAIQKNLLDLEHNRLLQYVTTTIILASSYVIGVTIAILGGQLRLSSGRTLALVSIITFVVITSAAVYLVRLFNRLSEITRQIASLDD